MAGVELLRSMFKDLRSMFGAAGVDAKGKNVQAATERRKTLSRDIDRRENLRQVSFSRKQNIFIKNNAKRNLLIHF